MPPDSQLELFGAGDRTPADALVKVEPLHLELARTLPHTLRLGTMSWNFPGWCGPFFGAHVRKSTLAREGLGAYAAHPLLRAVELDRTYYQPVAAELLAHHAAQVPEDFHFLVKAHEDCTVSRFPDHDRYGARRGSVNPRRLDVGYAEEVVVRPFVEGLGEKGAILLFQFSPEEVRSAERFVDELHGFLSRLPKGPRYAVEVRNPQLLTPAYGDALSDAGAAHCYNAWGRMPPIRWQHRRMPPPRGQRQRPPVVIRWVSRFGESHEDGRARFEPFDRLQEEDLAVRQEIAALAVEALEGGTPVYAFVSNRTEGFAPGSAFRLAAAIRSGLDERRA